MSSRPSVLRGPHHHLARRRRLSQRGRPKQSPRSPLTERSVDEVISQAVAAPARPLSVAALESLPQNAYVALSNRGPGHARARFD